MRTQIVCLVAVLVGVGGCGSGAGDDVGEGESGNESESDGGPDYLVELLDRSCPFEIPADRSAECYTLRVPALRDDPSAGTVELPVAVLHPPAGAGPSREPVVVLHGGPGGSNFGSGAAWFGRPLSLDGDLLLFDQRGSGESTPNLDCPEIEAGWYAGFAQVGTPDEELASMTTAVQQCRDRLAAEVDLDAFDTIAISDDLEDLRVALGIAGWGLYGASYGTRLALAHMRRHGEAIDAVVLDSVYPPQVGGVAWMEQSSLDALDRVIAGCLAEASCGAQFPDLAANLAEAIASLDAEPYSVSATDSMGVSHDLQLTGADLYAGLFNALYDPSVIPSVPLLIAIAGIGGNFGFLDQIADGALPLLTRLDEGARLSIDCADGAALLEPGSAAVDASLLAHPELATLYQGYAVPFCEIWDVEAAPADFVAPVIGDLPTLVIAGEYDPVTPVWQSEQTVETLAGAALYVFPGLGHGPSYNDDCAASMVRGFFRDGVVDDGCWAAISDTTFP